MLLNVLDLLLLLLVLLLLLGADNGVAEFGERLYRRLVRRLLEDRRRGRDDHGTAGRRNTKRNGNDPSGGGRRLQNVRPGRLQLRRGRSFGTLGVVLEGDVVVRVLGLRYLALAGGLEGNVALWNRMINRLSTLELIAKLVPL